MRIQIFFQRGEILYVFISAVGIRGKEFARVFFFIRIADLEVGQTEAPDILYLMSRNVFRVHLIVFKYYLPFNRELKYDQHRRRSDGYRRQNDKQADGHKQSEKRKQNKHRSRDRVTDHIRRLYSRNRFKSVFACHIEPPIEDFQCYYSKYHYFVKRFYPRFKILRRFDIKIFKKVLTKPLVCDRIHTVADEWNEFAVT